MMKRLSLFILAFCLAGCLGTTPNSNFYQLTDIGSATAVSGRKLSIRISEVVLPRYLDRPQIVTFQPSGNQLDIAEFDRWAEPFSGMFSRTLADDISLYLPKSVIKFEAVAEENFTYTVETEINKFDATLGKEVVLDIWWTVYKNSRSIIRERSRLQLPIGNSYESLVEKESTLIGELARQIAVKISKN